MLWLELALNTKSSESPRLALPDTRTLPSLPYIQQSLHITPIRFTSSGLSTTMAQPSSSSHKLPASISEARDVLVVLDRDLSMEEKQPGKVSQQGSSQGSSYAE